MFSAVWQCIHTENIVKRVAQSKVCTCVYFDKTFIGKHFSIQFTHVTVLAKPRIIRTKTELPQLKDTLNIYPSSVHQVLNVN